MYYTLFVDSFVNVVYGFVSCTRIKRFCDISIILKKKKLHADGN